MVPAEVARLLEAAMSAAVELVEAAAGLCVPGDAVRAGSRWHGKGE